MNKVIETLETRRSCRKYTDQKVPKEVITEIVECGTWAATGMGKQSPVILVIDNRDMRDRLSRLNAGVIGSDGDPFYGAQQVIVVLADRNIPTHVYDGSLVMGNLMNAAEALGVSSCWIHRAKEVFETDEGRKILQEIGVPDHYVGIGNLIIGYDDSGKRPPLPRKPDYIRWVE